MKICIRHFNLLYRELTRAKSGFESTELHLNLEMVRNYLSLCLIPLTFWMCYDMAGCICLSPSPWVSTLMLLFTKYGQNIWNRTVRHGTHIRCGDWTTPMLVNVMCQRLRSYEFCLIYIASSSFSCLFCCKDFLSKKLF